MATSNFKPTFGRGQVVLLLTRQAVELFLKGAILKANPDEKLRKDLRKKHSLKWLGHQLDNLYPDVKFDIPFRTVDLRTAE